MYHIGYIRKFDIYNVAFNIKARSEITQSHLEAAVTMLVKYHPVLRMSIQEKETDDIFSKYYFNELQCSIIDLVKYHDYSDVGNWKIILTEIESILENSGIRPMWRLLLFHKHSVKTTPVLYEFLLMFDHCIIDGIFVKLLISDFIEFLDLAQRGKLQTFDELIPSFHKNLEALLPAVPAERELDGSTVKYWVQNADDKINALEAYEKVFKQETETLEGEHIATNMQNIILDEDKTKTFFTHCKTHKATVTGAYLVASVLSFVQLLKPSLPSHVKEMVVPVIVTVDLRRYARRQTTDKLTTYIHPGCATLYMPLVFHVPLDDRLYNTEYCWRMAAEITNEISTAVQEENPLRMMRHIIKREIYGESSPEKSPFVLTFSNIFSVDDVVKPEQRHLFELTEYKTVTLVDIGDMPIFTVIVMTKHSKLHIESHACARYTSDSTQSEYMRNIATMTSRFSSNIVS